MPKKVEAGSVTEGKVSEVIDEASDATPGSAPNSCLKMRREQLGDLWDED